ncbi:MAG: helix-turn-helix domain-containing protein [Planctomycetaceae bacterium]|nr:helix-turn-helix domain-containing protein [Planctomycetaceae bacterium]
MQHIHPPALVTIREVARELACGRSTVYKLLQSGRLPSIRVNRTRRIRREDLQRLIDEGTGE